MESFKEKQLKRQLDSIFGNSEAGMEMKAIVLKAHTTGYTQEEMDEYIKRREEDLQLILERFKLPNMETVESKVIYNESLASNLLISADNTKEDDVKHNRNDGE